jgi:hypothetical protein
MEAGEAIFRNQFAQFIISLAEEGSIILSRLDIDISALWHVVLSLTEPIPGGASSVVISELAKSLKRAYVS